MIKNLTLVCLLLVSTIGTAQELYSNVSQQIIGNANVAYWEDAAHNVFIDLQQRFLDFLKNHLKNNGK